MWPFKKKNQPIEGRGFRGLISLANPVDDNLYLSSASKAAIVDKESGAYDEFLFTEDGHREMPFEQALFSHSELLGSRLEEYGRREIENRHRLLLNCQAKVARLGAQLQQLRERLAVLDEDLERQRDILDGHEKGDQEMYWTDSIPHVASPLSARLKLRSHAFTFVLVAIIDFNILKLSLQSLPGFNDGGNETISLTLSALGIQLVFPHLLGERLAYILRGHPKIRQIRNEAIFLALGWILFILTITYIRGNYIKEAGGSTASKQEELAAIAPVVTIMSLLMLVGLGVWMILLASRKNPHKDEYVHLLLAKRSALKMISEAEIDHLAAQGELPPLELSLETAHKSYRDAVEVAKKELRDAARMVYRRALINTMGHVEFTTSYLDTGMVSEAIVSDAVEDESGELNG